MRTHPDVQRPTRKLLDWTIPVVPTLLSIVALLVTVFSRYLPLPQPKVVDLQLGSQAVDFADRPTDHSKIVQVRLNIRNYGPADASNVTVDVQGFHQNGWTGVLLAGSAVDIPSGAVTQAFFQEDTVSDPDAYFAAGKHLYFALRTKWRNESTGRDGCAVHYLDVFRAPGGYGEMIPFAEVDGVNAPPSLPAIASCPKLTPPTK